MNQEEFINACNANIHAATAEVNAAAEATAAETATIDAEDVERKRKELLEARETLKKSESQISKANAKTILKWYKEYEAITHEKSVCFLCDLVLSKFSSMLGIVDVVDSPEELEKELKTDPLLRKDLKCGVSKLTPLIPFLGILSGALTVGKHAYNHTPAPRSEAAKEEEEEEKEEEPGEKEEN